MAKTKYKIEFESIILCVIALAALLVFFSNKFLPNLNVMQFFTAPTTSKGPYPFSFSDPTSYFRIFLHIFGSVDFFKCSLYLCLYTFIPNAERDYGTIPLVLMIALSAVFSGVLSACFSVNPVSGIDPVIFLLFFLNIFANLSKKKIPVLQFAVLALLLAIKLAVPEKPDYIAVLIQMAGGLCGSLVSFLTVPKTGKKSKSVSRKKDTEMKPARFEWFNNESESPRFKNNSEINSGETTVVGTIDL